ncbi:NlpC/P60 family protein [Acidothermus cellulolyticus]|uniref:C40 family peptidase n=1 Tax=Acidothermus cellulolyticus TaxID=28049 RepID=UPI00059FDEDE|nr:C40 family peptidase [Acidothermus cellulolyticus]
MRAGRWLTTVGLVVAFTVGATCPALADKPPIIPSQSEVDAARAAAQAKAAAVAQTEQALADANAQLQKLNDQVETLVEAYNGAMVRLQDAQAKARAAAANLAAARAAHEQAQIEMDQFAALTYMGAGDVAKLTALLFAPDPERFLTRAGTLAAIDRHRQGIIALTEATAQAEASAAAAAAQALGQQQKAADAAARAKDAAVQAVNAQAAEVAQITQRKQDLQAQLAVLQGKAKSLAEARARGLAELAAQRAAAAAAAAAAAKRRAAEQAASESGTGSSAGPVGNLPTPGMGHSISTPQQRAGAVAFARSQIGVWYRWAGAGEVGPTVTDQGIQNVPGYDCSGLVMRAYESVGIELGHYTGLQWDEGMHVSQDQLMPGDLVFFATNVNDPSTIHHVGIYIGNGQMIDAPQTGEQVGIHNAFRPDYIGAVRP